jgi:hypothetical protein
MAAEALRILSYDINDVILKDFEITTDESPDFYAHQLLHTGATCVEIRTSDESAAGGFRIVLHKCLPEMGGN